MRRRALMSLVCLSALAAASPLAALAQPAPGVVEVAGVRFEPSVTVGGQKLALNGAGIRYKFVFKVYAAGLYLAKHAATPAEVYAAPGAKRIQVTMLRDIDANELGKLFTQGMEKNSPREDFSKSIPGTLKLAELFARKKRLATDDTFTVDFVPGTGTVVTINGKSEIEPIKEPEFFNALMSIWLGKSPADNGLKDAMLGQGAAGR